MPKNSRWIKISNYISEILTGGGYSCRKKNEEEIPEKILPIRY